jgi:hypothetical protein
VIDEEPAMPQVKWAHKVFKNGILQGIDAQLLVSESNALPESLEFPHWACHTGHMS